MFWYKRESTIQYPAFRKKTPEWVQELFYNYMLTIDPKEEAICLLQLQQFSPISVVVTKGMVKSMEQRKENINPYQPDFIKNFWSTLGWSLLFSVVIGFAALTLMLCAAQTMSSLILIPGIIMTTLSSAFLVTALLAISKRLLLGSSSQYNSDKTYPKSFDALDPKKVLNKKIEKLIDNYEGVLGLHIDWVKNYFFDGAAPLINSNLMSSKLRSKSNVVITNPYWDFLLSEYNLPEDIRENLEFIEKKSKENAKLISACEKALTVVKIDQPILNAPLYIPSDITSYIAKINCEIAIQEWEEETKGLCLS